MSNKSALDRICLPKGGGAQRGLGEKLAPDPFTGAGQFSVPIDLPPGRNGFTPKLELRYSTGKGNSPFGLGWDLGVPSIARKTSKGIPRYDDDLDTFVLSGHEDLIPVSSDGRATVYRPRAEDMLARITHFREGAGGADYWEARQRDGSISTYGTREPVPVDARAPAVVADPARPSRRFAWRLTETRDPFGNRVVFHHGRDLVAEDGPRRWDQLYLTEVRYVDYGDPASAKFLVLVKLVYEDRARPDPFSEHRAGFEVRTIRRCSRIEVWTDAGTPVRLRTYHLTYADELSGSPERAANGVSLLAEVRVEGHDDGAGLSQELPILRLRYGRFAPERRRFRRIGGPLLPPRSLGHPGLELADLRGVGLPDIVEIDGQVRSWRNLGDGRFEGPRVLRDAPAGLRLEDPGVQLVDADGDGRVDLLVTRDGMSGHYPFARDGQLDRRSFVKHDRAPSVSLEDPDVRLLDLTGDGITDALRGGADFECYFQHPRLGWHAASRVERRSADRFPDVSFTDPRVKWADMTGDGLTDILLVHDGRVDYWPSLGYGHFGPRVTMRGGPRLPRDYHPRRVLVGDVDGDGVADLVYVEDHRVTLWLNRGGHEWSAPIEIFGTPAITDMDAVRLVDLFGTGAAGLLWSRDSGAAPGGQMFFLDLCGGRKPYLLERIENGAGAVTTIEYAPSTRFFLADEGTPLRWTTPLPIVVQVVARVEVIDQITGGKLATEYAYHHGYWDGVEREFRGFGRVDQRDTQTFDDYHAPSADHESTATLAVDPRHYSPPTELRTWFHLGPIEDGDGGPTELDCRLEHWAGDPQALTHPAAAAHLAALSPQERRDAARALRGRVLRTELSALDGSPLEHRPFTVTEKLHQVRRLEVGAAGGARPGVFFPFEVAERTTQWERGADPMTRLSFQGDHDAYGQPRRTLSLAVPRGRDYRSRAAPSEAPFLITETTTARAQRDDADVYLVDRAAVVTTYEIVDDGRAAAEEARPSAMELWERALRGPPSGRVVGQTLHHYDGDDFRGLPLGQVGSTGALKRTEELVLTEALLHDGYRIGPDVSDPPEIPPFLATSSPPPPADEYPEDLLASMAKLAGFVFHAGDEARERGYFAATVQRAHGDRGLVIAERDATDAETTYSFEDGLDLLPTRVTNPVGVVVEVERDPRVLLPSAVTDPNGNRTEYRYTPLGLLQSIAVQGKPGQIEGDPGDAPSTTYLYCFDAFATSGQPIYVHTTRRTKHAGATPEDGGLLESREYSDGFGRLLQTRSLAEDVIFGDAASGHGVLPADQAQNGPAVGARRADGSPPNVAVSGWQTYDNKGRVIETYEPFFSVGWGYAAPGEAERGRKTTALLDALGRAARTIHADGSERRVVFGRPLDLTDPAAFDPSPWEVFTYDANDNAGRTPEADPGAAAYEMHWNTPSSVIVDALGRTVEAVERTRPSSSTGALSTRYEHDIRGNPVRVFDALGRSAFRHVYDLANRTLRTEQLDSGARRIIYDACGRVVEERDAKGGLVLSGYDASGRRARLWARDREAEHVTLRERIVHGDAPDAGFATAEEARVRNLLGRPYKHYDEAGLVVFEAYDFKGNLLEKSRRAISDAAILKAFDPPPPGWQVKTFRVDWHPPPGVSLDAHAATLLDAAAAHRTTSRYDAQSRVVELVYPADTAGTRRRLSPSYNRAGALERLTLDGTVFVHLVAYDARGRRTLVVYGDPDSAAAGPRLMTRYAYDDETSRLVRLRTEGFTRPEALTFAPSGRLLQDMAYEHDLVGNVVAIRDRSPGSGVEPAPDRLDRTFGYDPLYRLLSATGREAGAASPAPWDPSPRSSDPTQTRLYARTYEYDPAGNLVRTDDLLPGAGGATLPAVRYELVEGTNRVASMLVGATAFRHAHDDAGNLVQENEERRFEWDHGNRLRAFEVRSGAAEPSQHAHYLYDARGQRVKKLLRKQGGLIEATTYVDGIFERRRVVQGGVVREADTLHLMDDEHRIAEVRAGAALAGDDAPAVKYHLEDHLGSSVVVVGQDGSWISREEYGPHGESTFGSFAKKRYRFLGKERDEESGLHHHGARYYASWLRRWTSLDPGGAVDGLNLYAYARNNPLRLVDTSGLASGQSVLEAEATMSACANTACIVGGPSDAPAQLPSMSEMDAARLRGKEDSIPGAALAIGAGLIGLAIPAFGAALSVAALATMKGDRPEQGSFVAPDTSEAAYRAGASFVESVASVTMLGLGSLALRSGAGAAPAQGRRASAPAEEFINDFAVSRGDVQPFSQSPSPRFTAGIIGKTQRVTTPAHNRENESRVLELAREPDAVRGYIDKTVGKAIGEKAVGVLRRRPDGTVVTAANTVILQEIASPSDRLYGDPNALMNRLLKVLLHLGDRGEGAFIHYPPRR